MKKKYYTILFILILFFFSGSANAYVFNTDSGIQKVADGTGHKSLTFFNGTPSEIIGSVIQIIISFLGVLFLGLTIYGGFVWMLAQGNDQQISKAKSIIKNSIIGLIIVMAAYVITITISAFLSGS